MAETYEIMKCNICGNVIEVLHGGQGKLICCGQPMEVLNEKSADLGKEKHVPVAEFTANGLSVRVGSVPHPMEESHYIEWIEISDGAKACRKFMKPGEKPEALFCIQAEKIAWVRAYCNVHGLWKS